MQIYDQKVDTQRFPGVTPGIESLKNFIKHFGLPFPDHNYQLKILLRKITKLLVDIPFLEIMKEH